MNILYLINYLGGGGTESYIYSLAKELKDQNKIYLAYNERAEGYEKFEDLGIDLIHLPMDSFYDLKAAKNLSKFCRDNEIHVVHSHFLRENAISVISKIFGNKAKLINTRHMLLENKGVTRLVNRFITRFNHSVIAVSESVENLLIDELGPRKNIELIYTGVDLESKSPNPGFRNQYGISKDTIVISSVARFSAEKGHEFLIRSIAKLDKALKSDYVFVFMGDGPELDKIKELTKALKLDKRIIFTGYEKDVNNILSESDIFLLGSKSEAFGISILEAMRAKLAVVTTDSGGTREIIPENSPYGILIDYMDYDSLVNSLKKLIQDEDLRKYYGRNGYDLVSEKFNLKTTIEETFKLYS